MSILDKLLFKKDKELWDIKDRLTAYPNPHLRLLFVIFQLGHSLVNWFVDMLRYIPGFKTVVKGHDIAYWLVHGLIAIVLTTALVVTGCNHYSASYEPSQYES